MLARSCHQSIRDVARTEHNLICPNSFRSGWNVDYSKLRYRWSWASRIRKMDRQSYVGCGESRVAGLAAGENLLGQFTRVWGIIPGPLFENLYRTSCGYRHRPCKMEYVFSEVFLVFAAHPRILEFFLFTKTLYCYILDTSHTFVILMYCSYYCTVSLNLHTIFSLKELGKHIYPYAQTFAFVTLVS